MIASGTAFLSNGRGESSGADDSGVYAMLAKETVPIASVSEVFAVETTCEGIAIQTSPATPMATDNQQLRDSSRVRQLLVELGNDRDIVIGSRFLGDERSYRIPLLRKAGIRFFSYLAWLLGGVRIRDVTSGFQAMRREVFSVLAREYPVDFPDAEVVVMLGVRKFRVAEVPAFVRERQGGESMYSRFGTALYYPFKSFLASFIVLLRLLRERERR